MPAYGKQNKDLHDITKNINRYSPLAELNWPLLGKFDLTSNLDDQNFLPMRKNDCKTVKIKKKNRNLHPLCPIQTSNNLK